VFLGAWVLQITEAKVPHGFHDQEIQTLNPIKSKPR
jgi:hypothetical protein